MSKTSPPTAGDNSRAFARDQLKAFVERVERLNEEIKELASDKSDLYKEAQRAGFDAKALKVVIQRRAREADEVRESDAVVALYEEALSG